MNTPIRRLLINAARKKRFIEYNKIMNLTGLDNKIRDDRLELKKILEDISRFEHSKGRPMLSALAMYKDLEDIGGGFWWLASELGYGKAGQLQKEMFEVKMQTRCFDDWGDDEYFEKFKNDDGKEAEAAAVSEYLKRVEIPQPGTPGSKNATVSAKGIDIDWLALAAENIENGKGGEELVKAFEKESLIRQGRSDLAEKVQKVKDGLGYDILSYDLDGSEKYIEVKTTKGDIERVFPITQNEINFSETNPKQYRLYRLFNYEENKRPIKFLEFKGDLNVHFELKAMVYKARRL